MRLPPDRAGMMAVCPNCRFSGPFPPDASSITVSRPAAALPVPRPTSALLKRRIGEPGGSFTRLDFIPEHGQYATMADENSRRFDKLESNLAHLEHQVERSEEHTSELQSHVNLVCR